MPLRELVLKNRSYRRFYEDEPITRESLEKWLDTARQTASAANRQPLKYILACEKEINAQIFSTLKWAGYLPEWGGPAAGERPAAYLVILLDKSIAPEGSFDPGIVGQTFLLAAVEDGFGGCMVGSIDRKALSEILEIDKETYYILLVIALGKPKEKVTLEEIEADGSIKYWRDENHVHHVPKRKLKDIILK
jgi:nitroreductase